MKITRTYPAPDDPNPRLGPRERAMAVLKLLLGLEPEEAAGVYSHVQKRQLREPHPSFAHVEAIFAGFECIEPLAPTVWQDSLDEAARILDLCGVAGAAAEDSAKIVASGLRQWRAIFLGLPTHPQLGVTTSSSFDVEPRIAKYDAPG